MKDIIFSLQHTGVGAAYAGAAHFSRPVWVRLLCTEPDQDWQEAALGSLQPKTW
jgi:hypothetical protein